MAGLVSNKEYKMQPDVPLKVSVVIPFHENSYTAVTEGSFPGVKAARA
jgi:hypothetical protein